MDKDDLYNLVELLCEFNCTYALDDEKEKVIDMAIDIVTEIMESEYGKQVSCKESRD